jgi:hypothetical protein
VLALNAFRRGPQERFSFTPAENSIAPLDPSCAANVLNPDPIPFFLWRRPPRRFFL